MSAVEVRFFASLREETGTADWQVTVSSVAALLDAIKSQFGEAAWRAVTADNVRIAVNQTLIDCDASLQPGDEVAFLPPVTGG